MRAMSCQVPDRAAPDWLALPGSAIGGPEDCDDDDGNGGGVGRATGGRSQPTAAMTTAASPALRQPVTASLRPESKTPLCEREVGAAQGFAGS
jgi:hypothetical protein